MINGIVFSIIMQVYKAPKKYFFFFSILFISVLSSCSKEHDLVSEFVTTEEMMLPNNTKETMGNLVPSFATESNQALERSVNLGK